jgi:hypothetical protein
VGKQRYKWWRHFSEDGEGEVAGKQIGSAVSRRTPVSCSMRRSGHPSRPRAITGCFFASFQTLLISTKATWLAPKSTSPASFSSAGFQVTLIGRFWVTLRVLAKQFIRADAWIAK